MLPWYHLSGLVTWYVVRWELIISATLFCNNTEIIYRTINVHFALLTVWRMVFSKRSIHSTKNVDKAKSRLLTTYMAIHLNNSLLNGRNTGFWGCACWWTNPIYVLLRRPALAVPSLTSHRMTSWWRWDLWRQMNFSLRDDKVVNRIENRSNGVEKLHLSSVSSLKSDGECVSVSQETKCLSWVADLRTDAFHQWLAITLTSVKQILYNPTWHPFSAVETE